MDEQLDTLLGYYLPIVSVLLIAAALRMIGADHFPVWTDEGWSTWAMSEPTFAAIVDKLASDRHPPLYFLAVGYWSQIAGESRLALRLPSILVGVLTVAMVFRIGDDTFGRTAKPGREDVSWYGMLMYAVLPVAVYYSQEIRHFGWFVGAVCWSSLLFVRVLRRPKPFLLALYAVSVALMMYTLYFGVWVVLLQVLFALVLWRGDARREWRTTWADKGKVIAAWAGAFVLYIPWFIVIAREQWAILTAGITAAPGTYLSTPVQLLELLGLLMGGGFALTFGLYLVGFWGALVSDRTDVTLGLRFANPAWLGELYVVAWGIGLFLLLALVNVATGVLSTRTMSFIAPALMLVIGAGVVRLRTGVRWSLLAGYILASVLLPPLIQPRLAYDTAANVVAAGYSPGDVVVLENGWDDNAFRYEMRLALGEDAQIIRTLPWVNNRDENVPVVPQIRDELDAARRLWVVQWLQPSQVMPYLDRPENDFERVLELEAYVGDEYKGRFSDFGADNHINIALYNHLQPAAAPPNFGDTFALVDAIYADALTPGSAFHIDLWWQALTPPALDYSVGVFLMDDDGAVVAEDNAPPSGVPPTSEWDAGALYHDRHTLDVPRSIPTGVYNVVVSVYHFATPDEPLRVDGAPNITLGTIELAP